MFGLRYRICDEYKTVYFPRKIIIPYGDFLVDVENIVSIEEVRLNLECFLKIKIVQNLADSTILEDNCIYFCEGISKDAILSCITMDNTYIVLLSYDDIMNLVLYDTVIENLSLSFSCDPVDEESYMKIASYADNLTLTKGIIYAILKHKDITKIALCLKGIIKGENTAKDMLIRIRLLDYLVRYLSISNYLFKNRRDLYENYLRLLYNLEVIGIAGFNFNLILYDKLDIKNRVLNGEPFESIRDDIVIALYDLTNYMWSSAEEYPLVRVTKDRIVCKLKDKFVVLLKEYNGDCSLSALRINTEREIYSIRVNCWINPYKGILLFDKTRDEVITTYPEDRICIRNNEIQLKKYLVLAE